MIEYNEKVYKKISEAGAAGVVLGIVLIVIGISIGTMSIVFGAKALRVKKHLIG